MANNQDNKADTYNWDTAFGITFENANKAIVKANSSPPKFSQSYHDTLAGEVTVGAKFGAWQLTGGSGSLVHMQLPVSGGTLTTAAGAHEFSGSAEIEVELNYLPQPSQPNTQNLKLKLTTKDPKLEPIVSVTSVILKTGKGLETYVQQALEMWLLANLQDFNHVFSAVDINIKADKDSFQWMKPTKVGYAVNTQGKSATDWKDYVFGVLAMTENRPGVRLTSEISPNIIPANCNAGLLISQERFLSKILMPGVYKMFLNGDPTDFVLTDDDTIIRNTKDMTFQHFEVAKKDGGDPMTVTGATVDKDKFTIEAQATTLKLEITDMHFPWFDGGYTAHLTYAGSSELYMDKNHHFQMRETTTPTLNVNVTESSAEKWTQIVVGVVEGIAFAVAGAMVGAALGPAAEAVGEGMEGAGSAAAEGVEGTDNALSFAGDGVSDSDVSNVDEMNSEDEAESSNDLDNTENESYKQKFKGYFKRNWRKILGMAIGGAVGAVMGKLPSILEAYSEDNLKDMPTLDEFFDQAVEPTKWPNSSGATLESLSLNESLQIGLNIKFDS